MTRPVIAVVSPIENAYSETFIQAHRERLDADVRFYFGGSFPHSLDGRGPFVPRGRRRVLQRLALRLAFSRRRLNLDQAALAASFRREGVLAVLAEYGPTGVHLLPVCRALELPLIVHFHGFDASRRPTLEQYQDGYQALFKQAASVIAVSRVMESRLLELGCPRDKLIYDVYGPNEAFFALSPADPAPARFVAVGRFVEKKAPHALLLAFAKVLERHPQAELVMGGDGPLYGVCAGLVRYLGLGDRVSLPGVMTPAQVKAVFADCIAFVQHSVTSPDGDMEGTPVAVLEASAAALPVIATRHAGIPDVVLDGVTGYLVEEHDIAAMASRMCDILSQPRVALAMGRAGRERVAAEFTLTRHIEVLDQCIHRAVLSGSSAQGASDAPRSTETAAL